MADLFLAPMHMRNYENPLASAAYKHVRSFYRSFEIRNRPVQWDEQGWFWIAVKGVWADLSALGDSWYGPIASADDLSRALLECGVEQSAISPLGAHTLVTLDNLSFVYRTKQYKNEGNHILIAPHRTGLPFGKCEHSFFHPFGPLADVADAMLFLDRSIPEIRQACLDALGDARGASS